MLLKFEPYPTQLEAAGYWMDQETEEIAFGGGKYGGKSHLGCNLILADALTYPETDYFIARESLNDLRKHTMPSVHEVFQRWCIRFEDYAKFNGMDNYIQCHNGSRVLLIQAGDLPSDPLFERFGSMQMTRGWIEEASQVSERAKTNLKATIGRKNNDRYGLKGKLLMTCNPKKFHWLDRDFFRPWVAGTLPSNRKFVRSLATDNVRGNQDYINNTLAKLPDPVMRARLFEGSWDYDLDPSRLMTDEAIRAVFTIQGEPGEKYIIADVARYGSDRTVISLWDGFDIIKVIVYETNSVPQAAEAIKSMEAEHKVQRHRVAVDDDGVGGGVADLLTGCVRFVNGAKPMEVEGEAENYKNLKTQCAYKLAQKVNAGKVGVRIEGYTDTISEELGWIKRANVDGDGKLQILSKDKVKEGLGRSPDFGDVFIMRMVFDLVPTPAFIASITSAAERTTSYMRNQRPKPPSQRMPYSGR